MIEYREIHKDEIKQVAGMVAESFGEYPMYTLTFRDEFKDKKEFIHYISKLNKVHIKANARKHKCFVGIKDEKIVSVALLQNPKIKRINIMNYILAGGISLLFPVGFKRLIDFFAISNKAHEACEREHRKAYYIELLAVASNHKGQRFGTKMIHDCLIPYAKSHDGNEITLITNTEKNCRFYENNGFIKFSEDELSWKDRFISNYSFVMKI